MKVLIIMGGFFPGEKYGGPPVSVDNFCSLMNDYENYIITRNHDLFEKERLSGIHDGWNDRGNCMVLYLSDEEYNKERFDEVIREIRPNLLYLQGLFQSCVFPGLQLAQKYQIPVLLAPRGELCSGAFKIKKWKKIPYIKLLNVLGLIKSIHWQSTSDEETEAIRMIMNVGDMHIHYLNNIPSIPKKLYQRSEKIEGEGKFIFLSRIHPKKNLLSAIRYLENVKGKVKFDIYGPIEDKEYWGLCQEACKKVPQNIVIEYKGITTHDKVHELFSKYDAFLFPTLSENFGHVIAESMSVGTPVIISDKTPWTGITEKKAGWAFSLDKATSFTNAIQTIVDSNSVEMNALSSRVVEYSRAFSNLDSLRSQYNQELNAILGSIK